MDLKINTDPNAYRNIYSISNKDIGQCIILRGRINNIYSDLDKNFLILRQEYTCISCYQTKETYDVLSEPWMDFLESGSIVDLIGYVENKCGIIINIQDVSLISLSAPSPIDSNRTLMFNCSKNNQEMEQRFDNRILDLRNEDNKFIFMIKSSISKIIRNYLEDNQFMEIHTPKLISNPIEDTTIPDTQTFEVKYFDKSAYLINSTHIYKQMMMCADFTKIYEIGPVYCAEGNLNETISIDVEMIINESYMEAVSFLEMLFLHLFEKLFSTHENQIKKFFIKHSVKEFKFNIDNTKITYKDAKKILEKNNLSFEGFDDFDEETLMKLAYIIKNKYGTDFFIIHQYPTSIRPFYTSPSENIGYSNSYDFIVRGRKVLAGCESINDYHSLESNAKFRGININKITYFLEAFRYGTPKHAGACISLEKLVMHYLGIENIRNVSIFPRNQTRLVP